MGRLASENLIEDCIPWEEAHPGAGKECEGKEWQIKMYHELTLIIHSPFSLCHLRRKVRSEIKPGKKNGWRKGGFWFNSHYSALLLIGIKFN